MAEMCFRFGNIPDDVGIQSLNCTGAEALVSHCNCYQDDHCEPYMPYLNNGQHGGSVKCTGT